MVKIQIKNRFTGSIIFEYSKENATIKDAVEKAVKDGANLDGANLVRANLYEANLYGANLVRANLDGANLVRANLDGANLDGANLDGANLDGANLDGANLYEANLYGANLVRANLDGATNLDTAKIPMFCKWSVVIIGDKIKIGCKQKTIKEWDAFFKSDQEFDTKRGTKDFNQIYAMYKAIKAYKIQLSKFKE